jgi:hypothetical protein
MQLIGLINPKFAVEDNYQNVKGLDIVAVLSV